jgi:hypothetical protein
MEIRADRFPFHVPINHAHGRRIRFFWSHWARLAFAKGAYCFGSKNKAASSEPANAIPPTVMPASIS